MGLRLRCQQQMVAGWEEMGSPLVMIGMDEGVIAGISTLLLKLSRSVVAASWEVHMASPCLRQVCSLHASVKVACSFNRGGTVGIGEGLTARDEYV